VLSHLLFLRASSLVLQAGGEVMISRGSRYYLGGLRETTGIGLLSPPELDRNR